MSPWRRRTGAESAIPSQLNLIMAASSIAHVHRRHAAGLTSSQAHQLPTLHTLRLHNSVHIRRKNGHRCAKCVPVSRGARTPAIFARLAARLHRRPGSARLGAIPSRRTRQKGEISLIGVPVRAITLSTIAEKPSNGAHDREEIFLDVNFSSYTHKKLTLKNKSSRSCKPVGGILSLCGEISGMGWAAGMGGRDGRPGWAAGMGGRDGRSVRDRRPVGHGWAGRTWGERHRAGQVRRLSARQV